MMWPLPWTYPDERYYYDWDEFDLRSVLTDGDLKSMIVDRLRDNPHTKDEDIGVDVEHNVVILTGWVRSPRAKRAAGDDAWDTHGVVDVSNQLTVRR